MALAVEIAGLLGGGGIVLAVLVGMAVALVLSACRLAKIRGE